MHITIHININVMWLEIVDVRRGSTTVHEYNFAKTACLMCEYL